MDVHASDQLGNGCYQQNSDFFKASGYHSGVVMHFLPYPTPCAHLFPSYLEVVGSNPKTPKTFSHQIYYQKFFSSKFCFFKCTGFFQLKAVPNFIPLLSIFCKYAVLLLYLSHQSWKLYLTSFLAIFPLSLPESICRPLWLVENHRASFYLLPSNNLPHCMVALLRKMDSLLVTLSSGC